MNEREILEEILPQIEKKMREAQHYYTESIDEEQHFWKGMWKAYIESYTIVVETLARVIKEVEK